MLGKKEISKSCHKSTMLFLSQALPGVVSTATSTHGDGTASTLEHWSSWWRAEATVLEKLWLNEMLKNSTQVCSGLAERCRQGLSPCFSPLDFHKTARGHLHTSENHYPLLKWRPGLARNRNWTCNCTPEAGGQWHCSCCSWPNQRPPGSRTDESLETKTKFPRTEGFASQWEERCSRARIATSLRFMQPLAPADLATVSKDSVKHWHLSALCKKDRLWGKVPCLRPEAMMTKKWDLHIGRWWSLNGHRGCWPYQGHPGLNFEKSSAFISRKPWASLKMDHKALKPSAPGAQI